MKTLRLLWLLLTPAERRRGFLLAVLSSLMAISTVAGLAALMPFFAVLADPAILDRQPWLATWRAALALSDPRDLLVAVGVGFLLVLLLSNALSLAGNVAIGRFCYRVSDRLRVALFEGYLRRDLLFHGRRGSARLAAAVSYESDRITAVLHAVFTLSTNVLMIVLISASIAVVDFRLAALVLPLLAGCYVLVYGLSRARLLDNGRIQTQAGTERLSVLEQGLGAIREILLTRGEPLFASRLQAASDTISRAAASTQFIGLFPRHLLESVAGAGLVSSALLLNARGAPLETWLPVLVFIAASAFRLLPALQQSYHALVTLRAHGTAVAANAADLRAAPPLEPVLAIEACHDRPRHRIELIGVTVGYQPGAPPVLSGLDLVIAAGRSIALVGANGSGKTTVADVLLGLLVPQSGCVAVDGVALEAADLPAWQRRVACVPQHIYLLDASVSENIAFGVPAALVDPDRVWEAARLAGALPFIEGLPRGFHERLGGRGERLSGGQRQLIGIARALYRQPAFLVLDEATSSLDEAAEAGIAQIIRRLRGSHTVLVIAHRAATVNACDEAWELADGRCHRLTRTWADAS